MDQDSDSHLEALIEDHKEIEEEIKDDTVGRSNSYGLTDLFHQKNRDTTTKETEDNLNNILNHNHDRAIFISPPRSSLTPSLHLGLQ